MKQVYEKPQAFWLSFEPDRSLTSAEGSVGGGDITIVDNPGDMEDD